MLKQVQHDGFKKIYESKIANKNTHFTKGPK